MLAQGPVATDPVRVMTGAEESRVKNIFVLIKRGFFLENWCSFSEVMFYCIHIGPSSPTITGSYINLVSCDCPFPKDIRRVERVLDWRQKPGNGQTFRYVSLLALASYCMGCIGATLYSSEPTVRVRYTYSTNAFKHVCATI